MWPWEHAVVGYLAYSLFCHLWYRDSPTGVETLVVVFASVLPDIIDKPLAWEFGVFESGYALGHSIFFAIPLAIVVGTLAHAFGRPRVGIAFGLGYVLHLPADVIPHYLTGRGLPTERVLWPVEVADSAGEHTGFTDQFLMMVTDYWAMVLAGDLSTYEWGVFWLMGFVFLLWLYDGAPVLRECLIGLSNIAQKGVDRLMGRASNSSTPSGDDSRRGERRKQR